MRNDAAVPHQISALKKTVIIFLLSTEFLFCSIRLFKSDVDFPGLLHRGAELATGRTTTIDNMGMGMLPVALLCFIMNTHLTASQHLLLRPSPSDHLPVPNLKEDPDPGYDPRKPDLIERTLRKKLGSNFDANFMAVSVGNLSDTDAHRRRLTGRIPAELRRLDLTATPDGLRMKIGRKVHRKFLRLLWAHSRCPVAYAWKDLGARFWPRYVKEGQCVGERSCSFPRGMFCKPTESVTKTFLRWYCQGFLRQKHCTWIQVQYPIISQCKCSC